MLQPIAIGILNAVPYVRQYKSHLVSWSGKLMLENAVMK